MSADTVGPFKRPPRLGLRSSFAVGVHDASDLDSFSAQEQKKNMKHRRGIDLPPPEPPVLVDRPVEVVEYSETGISTVGALLGWHLIGGRCSSCEREGWIDKNWLDWRFSDYWLGELPPKLRCRKCGNRKGNKLIIGKLPR